jgi:hypothetical protein
VRVSVILGSLSLEPSAEAAVTVVLSVGTSPSMAATHRKNHAHVSVEGSRTAGSEPKAYVWGCIRSEPSKYFLA